MFYRFRASDPLKWFRQIRFMNRTGRINKHVLSLFGFGFGSMICSSGNFSLCKTTTTFDNMEPPGSKKYKTLEYFEHEYKHYTDNPMYVYMLCDDKWLIILKKMSISTSNEGRTGVVNHKYAKYRAEELHVIKIINVVDGTTVQKIDHTYTNKNKSNGTPITYNVGHTVKTDRFDTKIDEVNSNGIHYFKTIEAAYYYRDKVPDDYTGSWYSWHDNGERGYYANYNNGKQHGFTRSSHDNGVTECTGQYADGKRVGLWRTWDKNRQKYDTYAYLGGEGNYYYTKYHPNGYKCEEGEYSNLKKTGSWVYWHENGNKEVEGNYVNGKEQTGLWTYFYDDGNKKLEGNYVDGKKTGIWTKFFRDGTVFGQNYYANGVEII